MGLRPKRALIKAPAEHRERRIAIIRSRHPGRPQCAKSGRSRRLAERPLSDPLLPFPVGPVWQGCTSAAVPRVSFERASTILRCRPRLVRIGERQKAAVGWNGMGVAGACDERIFCDPGSANETDRRRADPGVGVRAVHPFPSGSDRQSIGNGRARAAGNALRSPGPRFATRRICLFARDAIAFRKGEPHDSYVLLTDTYMSLRCRTRLQFLRVFRPEFQGLTRSFRAGCRGAQ